MNQKETVSIIIITFNSEKQIIACLDRILATNNSKNVNEVILIDNKSTDNTVKLIEELYQEEISSKKLRIVINQKNRGFASAVNLGIKLSKSRIILLVNPDVFMYPDTVKKTTSFLREGNYGIVGVKMVGSDGKQNGSYFRTPNLPIGIFEFTNLGKLFKYSFWNHYFYYKNEDMTVSDVDVVTGGFMMITKNVIEQIGYFDEKFFMYLEDVDYCLRAKKAGIRIGLCNTVVTHIGGASSKNNDKVNHGAWLSSRKRYFIKNFDIPSNLVIQPLFLIDELFIRLLMSIKTIRKNNFR